MPSRIQELIDAIENGEPVDLERVFQLQALDLARAGEEFVRDWIEAERECDAKLAEAVGAAPGGT